MALLGDLLVKIGIDADGVEAALGRVDGFFERHAGKIAAAGAAIGTAGGAALSKGLTEGLQIEQANDKLAAQLGATGPQAGRLGKIAGDLYSGAWGDSLGHVNEALRAVLQNVSGMSTASDAELKKVTASALDLATAFEQDVGETARAVGKLVKTGLVDDATAALDLLTRGFQTGANEADDLLDTVSEYSTKFRDIGLTGKQAMGLLSQGLKAGARDADIVADALKEFSIRAIDGSDTTKQGFKAIGLDAGKMAQRIAQGGPKAAQALDMTLDRLRAMKDPVKQDAAAVALFGTQAEDLGDALFALDPSKAVDDLGKVKGAAQNMGDTLNTNAQAGIESWRRKTDQMLAGMANAPGVFGDTAQAAAGIGSALAPIGADLGGLAAAALVGGKAFGPLASGVAKGAAAVGTASASIVASGARMIASMTATAARVVAGWVLIGVQALLNAARVALSWIIAFAPVVAIIAIIALVVALVIKHWDTIKAATAAAWSWIVGKIKAAGRAVIAGVSVLASLPGKVAGWFGRLRDSAVQKAQSLVSWMKGLPGRIRSAVGRLGSLLVGAGRSVVQGLWNGIKAMGGWLRDQIMGWVRSVVPGPVLRFLGISSPSKLFAGYGVNIAEGLAHGITAGAPLVERASSALGAAAATGNGSGSAAARTPVPSGVRATAAAGGGGHPIPIYIDIGGRRLVELLVDPLRNTIATKGGGDVQAYLGRGRGR